MTNTNKLSEYKDFTSFIGEEGCETLYKILEILKASKTSAYHDLLILNSLATSIIAKMVDECNDSKEDSNGRN